MTHFGPPLSVACRALSSPSMTSICLWLSFDKISTSGQDALFQKHLTSPDIKEGACQKDTYSFFDRTNCQVTTCEWEREKKFDLDAPLEPVKWHMWYHLRPSTFHPLEYASEFLVLSFIEHWVTYETSYFSLSLSLSLSLSRLGCNLSFLSRFKDHSTVDIETHIH